MVTSAPVTGEQKPRELQYSKWKGQALGMLGLKGTEVPGSGSRMHCFSFQGLFLSPGQRGFSRVASGTSWLHFRYCLRSQKG